jgi:hypothetical protein
VRAKPDNPARNQIPSSISEENLIKAIESSGYPLQSAVASKLSKYDFLVTEEWGFADRDTKSPRTLDLAAYRHLKWTTDIVPGLLLLVECKRSIQTYVFFRTLGHSDVSWFPHIAGLPHGGIIMLHEVDGMQAVQHLVLGSQAFGLDKLPFVVEGPDTCAAFSRADANGKKITLSGSDPFTSVIMPLASACDHAMRTFGYTGGMNSTTVCPHLILCIAVLDAPMLLVESADRCSDPILTPWVRVIRQEPRADLHTVAGIIRHYGVDLVHIDFFDTFVETHVLPFAEEFGKRASQLGSGPMLNGGHAPDTGHWQWTDITEYKR